MLALEREHYGLLIRHTRRNSRQIRAPPDTTASVTEKTASKKNVEHESERLGEQCAFRTARAATMTAARSNEIDVTAERSETKATYKTTHRTIINGLHFFYFTTRKPRGFIPK